MELWLFWWKLVSELRPAFARESTFLWFATALAGIIVRQDRAGVTSIVRSLGLSERCYDRLLDFFHSDGVDRLALRRLWVAAIRRLCISHRFNGREVLIADGIKAPKEGKKMPSVKLLHQESGSNSKPEYIMGHSCQAVAILCCACLSFFAIPLGVEIHEGLVFSNRDRRTLIDKLNALIASLAIDAHFYLLADAFYVCAKVGRSLMKDGHHLVSRVRSNAVAYIPALRPVRPRRGRPPKYGRKIRLGRLFEDESRFVEAPSPIAGEPGIVLRYLVQDLIWRPFGSIVRFVLVIHPIHGKTIFLSTDCNLDALQIIALYSLRFKIELSFKQATHAVGAYAYHFWMKAMKPTRRGSGNQYLHRTTDDYRTAVRRKMNAYHLHLQVGAIAQGAMQAIGAINPAAVWSAFRSWLRTIRPGIAPSETVTALAMSSALAELFKDSGNASIWVKFVAERSDPLRSRCPYALTG